MKKRIVAMLLVLAMMLGLSAQMVTAATPATYDVGYAKVDINPYAELKNATDFENFEPKNGASLLSLPIGGGNNVSKDTGLKDAEGNTIWTKTQMSTGGKTDDNGDGKIDKNDGLFATCIAVTDSQGNTVLMYSVDLLSAFEEILQEVRATLMEEYGEYGLSADRILINGSHTHSGPGMTPDYEGVYNTKYDFTEDYKIYKEFLIFQMVKAARVALADRSAATMHSGTIEASQSNAAKGKIGDTLNTYSSNKVTEIESTRYGTTNKVYNSVRHYKITAQEARKKLWGGGYYQDYLDRYQPASDGKVITYIAGNNFNGDWKTSGGYFTIDVTDTTGTVTKYVVTDVEPVSKTDDKMHILKFEFADTTKKPIALVNFRGHLPSVGDSTVMSSSMVNSFRYVLEQEDYRVSYMQGAAGNVNSATRQPEGLWMFYPTQESVDNNITDTTHSSQRHNVYGTELAEVALELLGSSSMKQVNTNGGEIRSTQYSYQSERKTISDLEYAAAQEYIRRVNLPAEDANKLGITDAMLYTDATTGENCAISSVFHANSINNSYSKNGSAGSTIDLYALTIGDGFAMVGASGELFDRYSKTGNLKENLWDSLKNTNTYGTPFVAGYLGNSGYFGSYATFDFTEDAVADGNISLVVGSYETLTNPYTQGVGEALVEKMDLMLDFLEEDTASTTKEGACPHCGKAVTWTALTQENATVSNVMQEGHYYLTKSISLTDQEMATGSKACIDLNGYTMTVKQGFAVSNDATLSILDSSENETGTITGYEAPKEGGVFYVGETGTLNLYSGTLNYAGEKNTEKYASGGIVYVAGSFNMFGGKVEGTEVNWVGGAIALKESTVSTARIAGGTITSGKVGARGACIDNCGTVILSGNPTVDSIVTAGTVVPVNEKLVFDGVFTGTVGGVGGASVDAVIGKAINKADIARARINGTGNNLQIVGTDVVVKTRTAFAYKNAEGTYTYTDSITSIAEGAEVILQKKIATRLSLTKNLKIDLNGYEMSGGVAVTSGKTLEVCDTATADYDVSDEVFGKINKSSSSGNIVGAEATEETDVYLKIELGGNYTFHAVDLNINTMAFRPSTQGLYFKHEFLGDEEVKKLVKDYGVALSRVGEPTEEALISTADQKAEGNVVKADTVIYTRFNGAFGAASTTSTLVAGIMKETNGYATNKRNANQPIYGRAYIRLNDADGTVIMGVTRQRSLRQQVECVDTEWNQLSQSQRNGLLRAFKPAGYARVLNDWTVPNMKNPTQTDEEQDILRVLAIGNSHTVDATAMLAEVFAAEMPQQKVMIGNMYKSGCSVGQHVSYATNNTVIYTYYENENGSWDPVINGPAPGQNVLSDGLRDQPWDVIMLHEMNADAVMENPTYKNNYQNLKKHIAYVNANSLADAKILWNLSWANPTDAALLAQGDSVYSKWSSDYRTYSNGDYTTMFSNMVSKTQQYIFNNPSISGEVDGMAPTGTAICYARNKLGLTDNDLYRDYTHVSNLGRLISAYVWYATITGQTSISQVNVDSIPGSLCGQNINENFVVTEQMKQVIIQSVNYALANPTTVPTK